MSLRPNEKTQSRRKRYKMGVDADEGRRKREDNLVEIRKNKREESLMKKRRHGLDAHAPQDLAASVDKTASDAMVLDAPQDPTLKPASSVDKTLLNLSGMAAGIWSEDPKLQLESTTEFKMILSHDDAPIDEVIKSGVVPRFVEFLTRDDTPRLQFEAAWIMTNIASVTSEHTKVAINHGAIPIFIELLASTDVDLREQVIWALGNVAGESTECRDYVLQCGALMPLLAQLNEPSKLSILRISTWTLLNLHSEHTKVAIDHGAIPIFIEFLASTDVDLREQVIWALGNVAGESTECRDYVLQCGALMPLLAQLNEPSKLSILRISAWTLLNLCRGEPQPAFEQMKPALPALEQLIRWNDEEVLEDACWALTHLSAGREEVIQSLLEGDVLPRLVELLKLVLLIIWNIVTGNDEQTQSVIDCGALPILANLLTLNYEKSIKRESLWTISNITAGTKEQIQSVIDANLIPTLVHLAQTAEFDVKKEALWAISNAITCGSHDQIKYLVEQGCIKPLCDSLVCLDLDIISRCLDGLESILKVGEVEKGTGGDMNYCQLIEDAEGLEKIENLQFNANNDIYQKVLKILETYWGEEEQHPAGDDMGF